MNENKFINGYEVILPTTGIKVFVRGITVKEQVNFQKTFFISEKSLYEKTLFFTTLAYNCIIDPPFTFQEFIDNYTDEDINSICFGIVYQSFGNTFKISEVCKDDPNKSITLYVNLDNVYATGEFNKNCEEITLDDIEIGKDIQIRKSKFMCLSDSLSFFTALNTIGINNINNFKLSPSQIESFSMLKKLINVRAYKVEEAENWIVRPLYTNSSQLKKWYDFLINKLINKSTKDLECLKNEETLPYAFSFNYDGQCECGFTHFYTLNFLQCLIELSSIY